MAEKPTMHPPIFFPPPPTAAAGTDSHKSAPFKLNFKTRPSTSDSLSSTSSTLPHRKHSRDASQSRAVLQQARSKVLAVKRTRQYLLLTQLLLAFSILILSVMFAYCAALPHSDTIGSDPSSSSSSTVDSNTQSFSRVFRFSRRDTAQLDVIVAHGLSEDASNNAIFTTRHALAALTFYSATLPLLTMAHTATELLSSLVRPETSQQTRIGDVLRACQARRLTTLLSFSVSTLLALGWTVMQLLWINCEIAGFMGPKKMEGQGACPVQIRGHRMLGISQLSVGKVVMGWIVVIIYIVYAAFMYLKVGVLKDLQRNAALAEGRMNTASFRRKARYEHGAGGGMQKERDTDAETVFIGIDIEKPQAR